MALKKVMVDDSGIATMYHRIALISIDVNNQNTVLVHSYLSEAGRQVEKDYSAGLIDAEIVKFPFVNAQFLHCEYDPEMTVAKAYEWLKTLPEFEGSENV